MKNLSPDLNVYWRVLKEQAEIEMVLKVNGTSWVGLGWRPRQLTAECKNFPLIGVTAAAASAAPSAEPEPGAEPEPVSEPGKCGNYLRVFSSRVV